MQIKSVEKCLKNAKNIPLWQFSGNHNKLLVLQNDTRNIYSLGFATPDNESKSRPISTNWSQAVGNSWLNPSIHCSCLWWRMVANTASSCVPWVNRRLWLYHSWMAPSTCQTTGVGVTNIQRTALGKSPGNDPMPTVPPVAASPLKNSTYVAEVVSYKIGMTSSPTTMSGDLITYHSPWWRNGQWWWHVFWG